MTNGPCDRCGRDGPWEAFETGTAGSSVTVSRTVCPDCQTPFERELVAISDALEVDE